MKKSTTMRLVSLGIRMKVSTFRVQTNQCRNQVNGSRWLQSRSSIIHLRSPLHATIGSTPFNGPFRDCKCFAQFLTAMSRHSRQSLRPRIHVPAPAGPQTQTPNPQSRSRSFRLQRLRVVVGNFAFDVGAIYDLGERPTVN